MIEQVNNWDRVHCWRLESHLFIGWRLPFFAPPFSQQIIYLIENENLTICEQHVPQRQNLGQGSSIAGFNSCNDGKTSLCDCIHGFRGCVPTGIPRILYPSVEESRCIAAKSWFAEASCQVQFSFGTSGNCCESPVASSGEKLQRSVSSAQSGEDVYHCPGKRELPSEIDTMHFS